MLKNGKENTAGNGPRLNGIPFKGVGRGQYDLLGPSLAAQPPTFDRIRHGLAKRVGRWSEQAIKELANNINALLGCRSEPENVRGDLGILH